MKYEFYWMINYQRPQQRFKTFLEKKPSSMHISLKLFTLLHIWCQFYLQNAIINKSKGG